MLEIKNLTGGYVHVPVLKDVSFTVESGQLVGLIGLNGAGKSTTINEIICLGLPTLITLILGLFGQNMTTLITVQNILFVLYLVTIFYKTHFRDPDYHK